MQYSSITTGAAVLLALAPTALSIGTAHVVNNCSFPVYFASVSQGIFTPMAELPTSGFSEVFSLPGVGVSIKIAKSLTEKPTQFEYTWADEKINYDISNIDGNPFLDYGMLLSPSAKEDSANPTCKPVTCKAGEAPCYQAYNAPDDVRTMVCNQDTDLTMTLCPTLPDPTTSTPVKRHGHRVHSRQMKL